jgi:predicted DNA-binding ArsR family transcriptional regulator
METKVRKQGEYVTVVYQYQGDSLIINTGWKVPSAYWCSESEVSTSYPHYDAILQDVMESMSHLKYLATMSVGIFGEPTVENIRKLVSENKGLLSYDFFDQFHKYLSEHFDLSQEQFSELINLRELLIEFELFTMTPVDKELFELGMKDEFLNWLYFIKKFPEHGVDMYMFMLDDVLKSMESTF